MLGIVKPDAKYAWLIYGKYNRVVLYEALKDLGYEKTQAEIMIKRTEQITQYGGINSENVSARLLALIGRIIMKFEQSISYGGTKVAKSSYYINTMEAAQDPQKMEEMVSCMSLLIAKNEVSNPEFILVPKGGNPSFAKAVAEFYGCPLIIAKPDNDKSFARLSSGGRYSQDLMRVNYEGSVAILKNGKKRGIVLDCNASGGSQLLEVASEFNKLIDMCELDVEKINSVYVLFRVDVDHENTDQKFEDYGCKLYRYFDLSEEEKGQLYTGKYDFYNNKDRTELEKIIENLKNKKCFYWKGN